MSSLIEAWIEDDSRPWAVAGIVEGFAGGSTIVLCLKVSEFSRTVLSEGCSVYLLSERDLFEIHPVFLSSPPHIMNFALSPKLPSWRRI